jgi:YD repeat-containing protein
MIRHLAVRLFHYLVVPSCLLLQTTIFAQMTGYSYDSLNRLTRVVYSDGTIIVYTYDAAGNRLTTSTSGGCGFGLTTPSAKLGFWWLWVD